MSIWIVTAFILAGFIYLCYPVPRSTKPKEKGLCRVCKKVEGEYEWLDGDILCEDCDVSRMEDLNANG